MQTTYREEKQILIPGPCGYLEAQIGDLNKDIIAVICHPHPLFQGNMHNKVVTTLVRAWQALGVGTVRFNYRGVGKSDGHFGNAIGEIEDLKAVIRWITEQKVSSKFTLWLGGFSFGALVSARAAADMQQDAEFHGLFPSLLLSIAPVVNHFQLVDEKMPLCPWIIFQAEEDELITVDEIALWFQNVKKRHPDQYIKIVTLSEATHFFHGKLIELQQKIEKETCVWLGLD